MSKIEAILEFEWDDAKAESNYSKHGIDFKDAVKVFSDPYAYEDDDDRFEYGEKRVKIVGAMGKTLIAAVVYTDRANKTRLISARKARKDEKEKYYDQSKAAL